VATLNMLQPQSCSENFIYARHSSVM